MQHTDAQLIQAVNSTKKEIAEIGGFRTRERDFCVAVSFFWQRFSMSLIAAKNSGHVAFASCAE